MKVAIIGYGFVGKALENGLKKNVQTFLVDPKLETELNELNSFLPEIIFICVPTPMNNDGSQMISILNNVIKDISTLKISPLVVIKSTVLPKYLSDINKSGLEFVYNPEFLREKYANEDFINSELILFGGRKNLTAKLAEFYNNYTNCINKHYHQTDLVSASLIKYSINTFLSNKVIFFNELYNIFQESESKDSWDNITKIISSDTRIGSSHMQVPGHDGRFGFGGPCLPKDCQALFTYSKDINKPMTLLKQVIETNNIIRNSYETLSDREIEQNVKYKDNK